MKKLTIAIPTYNREKQISNLISFLYKEFSCIPDDMRKKINIYISDNCSIDKTEVIIKKSELFTSKIVDIHYHKNQINLGMAGNFDHIFQSVKGEYLWMLGDDDEYKEGIVNLVIENCINGDFPYMFINHSTFKDGAILDKSVLKDIDPNRTDKEVLWDLFVKSGTVMMFISACVYKTKYVKDFSKHHKCNLATPCYISFYCATKGRIKIIAEPMIINDWTGISWTDQAFHLMNIEIPKMLLRLPLWGYSLFSCYKFILHIFKRDKALYKKELFKNMHI